MIPQIKSLPKSYHDVSFTQIKVSNHPPSSVEVTPIVIVTLYRPKMHNAFTDQMMEEMVQAWEMFNVDDRVKCVILTGHGRMFCAGADLALGFGQGGMVREKDHRDSGGRVALAIHRCSKPTIAAVNGPAVGIGITMTLPCTIRVARADAKVGFVFGRRGIVMEAASSFFLPRLIGYSKAMRVCTTGEVARADSKVFDGLFAELVECDPKADIEGKAVVAKALELAQDIVANMSTVAAYLMRELMWRGAGWSAEEAHLQDSAVIAGCFAKTDNTEGVKAFQEKRPVKFTGTLLKDAPQCYPWWPQVDISINQVSGPRGNHQAVQDKSKL